jgi:hypothetical protein
VYQARVYKGSIRLNSSFWPNSSNTVHTAVWFQEDLPYPGVDLQKLKPKTQDSYPDDIAEFLMMNEKQNKSDLLGNWFSKEYAKVLEVNWDSEYNYDDRLFINYIAID